jgi:23S rRNA pseudouridine1911/1915/1917 synthase
VGSDRPQPPQSPPSAPDAEAGADRAQDSGPIVLTFRVAREHAGQRLDRFVQSRIPRLSRTRAQQIVRACAQRQDGSLRRPSDRVREGETVRLVRPPFEEPETPQTFGVVYEDEHVLAVDKPAGLPVHPSATYHRNTLTRLLRERYGDPPPHIAHRLDRETSGLVVCGRGPDSERSLKIAFEQRRTDKSYLAIVRGRMEQDQGVIELPLASWGRSRGGRDPLHVLMEVSEQGTRAVTRYLVRERAPEHTLVALKPITGRQHQLRVHLSAVGHSIVGDKLYGPEGPDPFLESIETGMTPELQARLGHGRQALHAHWLRVTHPRDGSPLALEAELAPDLAELWHTLGGRHTSVDPYAEET